MTILKGIRILDLTVFLQGPLASVMLADLGAEVIKVEPPGGDPVLVSGVVYGAPQIVELDGESFSIQYESVNRGKQSIILDLKTPSGMKIFGELVKVSDVVITNLRSGALKRLGISYEYLRNINEKIIYVTTTIAGSKGPHADIPGFDISGMAWSGLMYAASQDDDPVYPVGAIGDVLGGTLMAFATVSGILARERVGVGQHIETSQLGGLVWLQFLALTTVSATGVEFRSGKNLIGNNPLYGLYRCRDDRWIVLSLYQSDQYWPALCEALTMTELKDHPKFHSSDARSMNSDFVRETMVNKFAALDRSAVMTAFQPFGIPVAPVNRVSDVLVDEQILANQMIDVSESGPIPMVYLPFPAAFSATPTERPAPAPTPGGNTDSILTEVCGYDADEIAEFAIGGAFG
jgi:crotonobetainyl-CoA:carnitine CoA-transferase CaiB-like acyl-CoA transferase